MADIKGMLTKKLGPLPAYGWGIVIGGGYIAYRYMSGKGLSLSGTSTSDTSNTTGDASTSDIGSASGGYGDYIAGVSSDDSATIVGLQNQLAADATQIASQQTTLSNENARVASWKAWGEKWKTQAEKNAKNHRTTVKDTSAKKAKAPKAKGTQGTHIVKPIPSARKPGTIGRGPNAPSGRLVYATKKAGS
jgi:hypothetical protein